MRNKTAATLGTLRKVIEGFIDHPDKLLLVATEHDGSVFWTLRGAGDDQPKLVGRRGKHVRAIRILIEHCGRRADEVYRFKLFEPEDGERKEENQDRIATAYDPEPARALLERAAALALGSPVQVTAHETAGQRPPFYRFRAHVADLHALNLLVEEDESGQNPCSLFEALAMLWAARGRKDGVRIAVETGP